MTDATSVGAIYERRRHQRVAVPEALTGRSGMRALNLSESGMLLASNGPLTVGRSGELEVDLPQKPVTLYYEVRRCQESKSIFDTDFRIGIEFVDISIEDSLRLRCYINSLANNTEEKTPDAPGDS